MVCLPGTETKGKNNMAEQTKSTVFGNSLIWFGAAVSIAEILTGTLFAPLGFGKALCHVA